MTVLASTTRGDALYWLAVVGLVVWIFVGARWLLR